MTVLQAGVRLYDCDDFGSKEHYTVIGHLSFTVYVGFFPHVSLEK